MGCGNNKVSRSYLTSQPITTPSARAAKATIADLGTQILRLAAQEMKDSAARAEKARRAREGEAKAAAAAAAKKAAREAADKVAKEKKDEEEAEIARRFQMTTGRPLALETFERLAEAPIRLPGQPEKTPVVMQGKTKLLETFVYKLDPAGNLHALVDAQGNPTRSADMHLHTIVKTDGSVVVVATDRRNGEATHERAEILVPDAPSEMYSAVFELMGDLLGESA